MSDGTVSWRELERGARDTLEAALGGNRRQEARWIVERVSGWQGGELERSLDEPVSARPSRSWTGSSGAAPPGSRCSTPSACGRSVRWSSSSTDGC